MRTCPRCGYVDPTAVEGGRRYDKKRGSRAAYMRAYRKKKKARLAAQKSRKP
jgi:hypothetical protein